MLNKNLRKMIKVEHTKTHKIYDGSIPPSFGSPSFREVLVTNAELVLVECGKEDGLLGTHPDYTGLATKQFWQDEPDRYFKPILISKQEKVEEGDWFYSPKHQLILKCEKIDGDKIFHDKSIVGHWALQNNQQVFKILALPEHFSPQQLQMIVDGKLKEGKCLVECETRVLRSDLGAIFEGPNGLEYLNDTIIKLNPHIAIYPPVEEKMYTREQMEDFTFQAIEYFFEKNAYYGTPEQGRNKVKKWFEQNVK